MMCPRHPQAAVVRGAAIRGLEGIAPRIKQSRKHYGFSCNDYFREGIDPEEKAYTSVFYNKKFCSGRVTWLIHKGDEIFQDTFRRHIVSTEYSPGKPISINIEFYSSTLNAPPDYVTDPGVEEIGQIVSAFPQNFEFGSSSKQANNIHRIFHQVQVKFGNKGNNITCQNVVNDKVVSTATIEFNRN